MKYSPQEHYDLAVEFLQSGQFLVPFAKSKGICHKTVKRAVDRYRHQIEYDIKDDQRLTGVSKYTSWKDEDGNTIAQWVKTDVKHEEAIEQLARIAEGLIEDIEPVEPMRFEGAVNSALFSCYIISDYHLGQYSWIKETGQEWNLDIAYKILANWIDLAIDQAPDSEQAVLCDLGDFLHADGMLQVTPASKHVLDASGRFFEAVDVAIALFDYAINKLLQKHKSVHVIICEGNHNETTAHLMPRLINRKYENEPRVTFDMSQIPYYAFQWGNTATFFHHGHKRRMNNVAETFAAQFREIFGACEYRYGHMGHLHHIHVKESPLMVLEQHSTLAAKDAYSARGGYHSQRGASVVTYHKRFGEVGRLTIRPEMLS